jgi:hypothetical protein
MLMARVRKQQGYTPEAQGLLIEVKDLRSGALSSRCFSTVLGLERSQRRVFRMRLSKLKYFFTYTG